MLISNNLQAHILTDYQPQEQSVGRKKAFVIIADGNNFSIVLLVIIIEVKELEVRIRGQ